MRCGNCGTENPEGTKFCGECGAPSHPRCPQCGFANLPATKFCRDCGASLAGQPSSPSPSAQPPRPEPPRHYTPRHLAERILAEQAALEARGLTDGERKTITALFADLKGSTALIEGLDPEEARAILDPALQVMMDAVHRYEGYVAQALGDGIFALFGAPIAHEDHAHRALHAALRMQEEMGRYSDDLRRAGKAPLQIRVGVNTGEVVVRSIRKDDLHTDYVPVGHSTNLAARMEQLANPGSILITEYTKKLTEGFFAFKALGAVAIKGVEVPLPVYEVVGTGPLRTRLQVTARRGLTRFVGRHNELGQLRRALEQAKAGRGQIVGVMGEPGLGKSRLFYEFKLTSQAGCLLREAYSVSHGKATPYLPVIELLKNYFDITVEDEERKRREKIGGKVLMLDRGLEETLPYLFALLGVEDHPSPLQQMDPQIRRHRTFDALKKLFLRESLNQPLILIFEDLHWIDSETQGFLELFSEGVVSARILLLVNYRPEYRHEWGQKSYYTQLRLTPLGKAEAEEFLDVLLETTAGVTSPSPLHTLKQLILEKTEGTPFFMEEVVQELFEREILARADGKVSLSNLPIEGSPTSALLHIPTTVQGVLAARIDRLAVDEKALLQALAVIGREFPLSLVRQVVTQPEDELYRLLASLQQKEFLYEQPAFPEVEYRFKHALTQEVAYGTVLQERRKILHERIAQAIELLFHVRLEDHYEALAHHYTRSGNTAKAVEYLHLAGQQAVQRTANGEAISQFTTALELLQSLPPTPARNEHELALQLSLGPVLIAAKGYGAPEVEASYTRARELCQQSGDTPQLFQVLMGLSMFYGMRNDIPTGLELAKQGLSLAQRLHHPALLVEVDSTLGQTLAIVGDFVTARPLLEQGISLYDPAQHGSLTFQYGEDPGVGSRAGAAWTLWFLGYPDQARQQSHAALTLATELARPSDLTLALNFTSFVHQFLREGRVVHERAERVVTLATEQGLSLHLAWGTVMRGWALAEQGQGEAGLAQVREGLPAYCDTGGAWQPQLMGLLAETYGKVGQIEAGLRTVAQALARVDTTGERSYEAELYRLQGELTLQVHGQNLKSEAEASFQKALKVARRQEAKSWELRAATSLARLWQHQDKKAEAHQLLFEVYNWFTEGFDTKDLREAKALLQELKGA